LPLADAVTRGVGRLPPSSDDSRPAKSDVARPTAARKESAYEVKASHDRNDPIPAEERYSSTVLMEDRTPSGPADEAKDLRTVPSGRTAVATLIEEEDDSMFAMQPGRLASIPALDSERPATDVTATRPVVWRASTRGVAESAGVDLREAWVMRWGAVEAVVEADDGVAVARRRARGVYFMVGF